MVTALEIVMFVTVIGVSPARPLDPDACSLVSEAQASAALEVKVGAGQHSSPSSTKACMWTDNPTASTDHRRLVLTISNPAAFDVGKTTPRFKAELVSGVGEDAYYEFFGSDAPILVVKKGGTVFTVRILNGLKLKALGQDAIKAKELEVAKAAVTKL